MWNFFPWKIGNFTITLIWRLKMKCIKPKWSCLVHGVIERSSAIIPGVPMFAWCKWIPEFSNFILFGAELLSNSVSYFFHFNVKLKSQLRVGFFLWFKDQITIISDWIILIYMVCMSWSNLIIELFFLKL